MLVVLGICFVAMVWKVFSMIGEQEDRIDELCERLSNLEKSAMKMTFDDDKVI
jgi:hypothetical protein